MPKRIDEVLRHIEGSRILDVGCAGHNRDPHSPDWLHSQLRKHFPFVIGIDNNEGNIRQLRGKLGYQDIYVENAETFKLPDQFDSIVAGEIIEHLSNPGLFFQQAKEHLTAGGRIILTTPYAFSLVYVLYALLRFPNTCSNAEHTCWFCPQTLKELVQRAGFRVVHWDLIEDYKADHP